MEPGTQVSSVDFVDEISDPERAVTKLIEEFALFGLFRDWLEGESLLADCWFDVLS